MSRVRWLLPLQIALAAMWVVHGLEKFGVRWPAALAGGTHSISGMLGTMADETPFAWFKALIEGVFLPGAKTMQYPIGMLEIAIGIGLVAGVWTVWFALAGAALQTFIGLGFATLDWPLQYPFIVTIHLILAAAVPQNRPTMVRMAIIAMHLVLAELWIYAGATDRSWLILLGLAVLAGVGWRLVDRALAAVAGVVAWLALTGEWWGSWPWLYYLVVASHVTAALAPADLTIGGTKRWQQSVK